MRKMDLVLNDKTNSLTEDQLVLLANTVNQIGDFLGYPSKTEMSITLMDDLEIKGYNQKYRNLNGSTDVISFALEEADNIQIEGIARNIGDILISVDHIKKQSELLEHSFNREMVFLVMHGMLHLSGFDHIEPDDEKVMINKQHEIIDYLGYDR
jgi:probable rRNA maturation factor